MEVLIPAPLERAYILTYISSLEDDDYGWKELLSQKDFFKEEHMTVNVAEAYKIFKDLKEYWPPVSVRATKKMLMT